jgi:hypothetical protein
MAREPITQRRRRFDEDDPALSLECRCNLELVIVHVLSVTDTTWYDDGHVTVCERGCDRPDAGVAHDSVRRVDFSLELRAREMPPTFEEFGAVIARAELA